MVTSRDVDSPSASVKRSGALQQLHSDLWIADSTLRFFGLEIGSRMSVVRLPGPKLLLHSPIAASAELVREVRALGPVCYLVAPNRFHHLFVAEWQRAFAEAAVYAAPGLEAKRPDLRVTATLSHAPEPDWSGTLEQVLLDGLPLTNEVVFFHRPSATLLATDLAFNIGPCSPPLTRGAFRLAGAYGRLAPTRLERMLVRDRSAFASSLKRILDWPFERAIVAHGRVVESGGRAALARGFAWALRS